MYVRTKTFTNKDGSTRTYLYLVETVVQGVDILIWTKFRIAVVLVLLPVLLFSLGYSFVGIHPFAEAVVTPVAILIVSTSYKSLLSTPDQKGMLDLLVKEAFRRIGLEAEIVFNLTGRSLSDVNEGLADGELNRIEGMEKNFPNLVMVPEPNMVMDFVAFSKRDLPIDGWDSIRGLRVGIVRGGRSWRRTPPVSLT